MPASHPVDSDCIFCKIVAGAIPCHKLHEDAHTLAFLDIGPIAPGHVLVIPKAHYVTLDQVPAEVAAACAAVLPRLSKAVVQAVGATAWNVLQNNGREAHQAVMHVHFHIIPVAGGRALDFKWQPGKLAGDDAARLRQSIVARLGNSELEA
ncbi:MAG: HIT domain-containing protein [Phycisphaeraceae bacterium]